jgi:hypothetical protein
LATLRRKAEDGTLLVRENLVLAFFVQATLDDVAEGFRRGIELWLEYVPREVLSFGEVGASASERKAIGQTTLSRCLARLKSGGSPRGDLTYFMLQGPEEDNPSFRIEVSVHHELDAQGHRSSLLEFRFPADDAAVASFEAVAALAENIAAVVPFDSGYLAPAVSWSYESDLYEASKVIGPLGLRHPGLDIHFNVSSSSGINRRCRGPYWITLVGPPALQTLGGLAKLEAALPGVKAIGNGAMITTGTQPAIGDVNRNDKLPELRKVAAVLEPVTFFGDNAIRTYLFGRNDERFARWDRRLLD